MPPQSRLFLFILTLGVLLLSTAEDDFENFLKMCKNGHTGDIKTLIKERPEWLDKGSSDKGATCLYLAAHYDQSMLLKALLIAGANPNIQTFKSETNQFRLTPLAVAATKGHVRCTERLLEYGADANAEVDSKFMNASTDSAAATTMDIINRILYADDGITMRDGTMKPLPEFEKYHKIKTLLEKAGGKTRTDLIRSEL